MGGHEETVDDATGRDGEPSSDGAGRDGGSPDDSGGTARSAPAAGRAASVSPDALETFRSFEENAIARTGTVVELRQERVDDGAEPSAVAAAVRETVAEREGITEAAAADRIVASSRPVIEGASGGTHAFVAVRLPSGHVFVDGVRVPEREGLETPSGRRYRAFVDRFGHVEALSAFAGEPVPIEYDGDEGRWRLSLGLDAPDPSLVERASRSTTVRAAAYALAAGLFAVGLVGLAGVPTSPTAGALSPRSVLTATVALLGLGVGIDVVRTALERGWLPDRRSDDR